MEPALDAAGLPLYPHYQDPLRGVRRLRVARTDQGVDYFGMAWSPIYPIGRCHVTWVSVKSGWPGGGVVHYLLLDGSHAGEIIYVAEWIKPAVAIGDVIEPTHVLARFRFNLDRRFRGIETGFIRPGTHEPCSTDTSGRPTEGGIRMTRFLNRLGCPSQQHFGAGPDTCPCGRIGL